MSFLKSLFSSPPDVIQLQIEGNTKGLIRALTYKDDSQLRIEAAQALGKLGDPVAIPALIDSLGDILVRDTSVEILARFGPQVVDPLIAALNHDVESVRLHAMKTLAIMGDNRAVPDLLKALNHPKPQMRETAATALGQFDDESAILGLAAAITDKDAAVREAAVLSLGESGHPMALKPLTIILRESQQQVLKAVAVKALGEMGSVEGIDALIEAYQRGDVRRDLVLKALGKIGDGRVVPILVDGLTDATSLIRDAALDAMTLLNSTAVEPLIDCLSHSNPVVRSSVAENLGRLGDSTAIEPLIRHFIDPDSNVQTHAAESVGKLADDQTLTKLAAMLNDQKRDLRWCAAWALWHSGSPSAVEPLIGALNDKDSRVREVAIIGLRSTRDSRALQPLITCLQDKDSDVRKSALKSVALYGGPALNALIDVLESDDGELKALTLHLLTQMAGESHDEDIPAWRKWAKSFS
jgi:HEAT repeat protein